MSSFTVLGLSGKSGSGKDYIAQNILSPVYKLFSLSWAFKVMIVGTGEATYEEVFVTKPPHVRRLLQLRGTEEGRNVFGEDVWCKVAHNWMRLLSETWQDPLRLSGSFQVHNFVIADIRFKNEVQYMQNVLGAKIIRIEAPERVKNNKLTEEQRLHISETDLDDYHSFDKYIANDYTSDAIYGNTLEDRVRTALSEIYFPL